PNQFEVLHLQAPNLLQIAGRLRLLNLPGQRQPVLGGWLPIHDEIDSPFDHLLFLFFRDRRILENQLHQQALSIVIDALPQPFDRIIRAIVQRPSQIPVARILKVIRRQRLAHHPPQRGLVHHQVNQQPLSLAPGPVAGRNRLWRAGEMTFPPCAPPRGGTRPDRQTAAPPPAPGGLPPQTASSPAPSPPGLPRRHRRRAPPCRQSVSAPAPVPASVPCPARPPHW